MSQLGDVFAYLKARWPLQCLKDATKIKKLLWGMAFCEAIAWDSPMSHTSPSPALHPAFCEHAHSCRWGLKSLGSCCIRGRPTVITQPLVSSCPASPAAGTLGTASVDGIRGYSVLFFPSQVKFSKSVCPEEPQSDKSDQWPKKLRNPWDGMRERRKSSGPCQQALASALGPRSSFTSLISQSLLT